LGLRERLAKANWELNYFFKTGRWPRYEYPIQSSLNTPQIQSTQFNGSRGINIGRNDYILCVACKNYVPKNSNYCDKCGKKLR